MVVLGPLHEPYASDDESSFTVEQVKQIEGENDQSVEPTRETEAQPGRKSVRFFDRVRVHAVPSHRELSEDEHRDAYMNDDDKRKIRQDIKRIIRQFLLVPAANKPTTTPATHDEESLALLLEREQERLRLQEELRGLEAFFPSKIKERREKTRMILQALLKQQDEVGKLTDDWIHHVFQEMSAGARLGCTGARTLRSTGAQGQSSSPTNHDPIEKKEKQL